MSDQESLSFEFESENEDVSEITQDTSTSFTVDSELGRDVPIDDRGNILPHDANERELFARIREGGHPLLHILNGFGLEADVLAQFLKLNISTTMLASLTDLDLVYFGVHDSVTRRQMLKEFKRFPNQENTDAPTNAKVVLANVFKNLIGLRASLGTVLDQMYANSNSERVTIDRPTYSALLVLPTLDHLDGELSDLESRFQMVQFFLNTETAAQTENTSSRSTPWLFIAGSAALVGFCVWRSWGDLTPFNVRTKTYIWLNNMIK